MLPSDWQGLKQHYLDNTNFPVTTFNGREPETSRHR